VRMQSLLPYVRAMVDTVSVAMYRGVHCVAVASKVAQCGDGRMATTPSPNTSSSTSKATKLGDNPLCIDLTAPTDNDIDCLHPDLIIAMSRFVSKWYPQVPDEYVRYFLPATNGGQNENNEDSRTTERGPKSTPGMLRQAVDADGSWPRFLNSGYVLRRRLALQAKRVNTRRNRRYILAGRELNTCARKCSPVGDTRERDVPRVASSGFSVILASTLRDLRLFRGSPGADDEGRHCVGAVDEKKWRNLFAGYNLSFHLRGRAIKFVGPSYRTTLHLTNRSLTKKVVFVLHASPSKYFRAVPAFGVLDPQSTCTVITEFLPSGDNPNTISTCIPGFIRICSVDGFSFERIDLVGYNTPLLRTYDTHIAFGFCPVNHVRSLPLYVENVGLVPSNCTIHFQSNVPFRASPAQCLLQAGEVKRFELLFEPRMERSPGGIFVVRGMGT